MEKPAIYEPLRNLERTAEQLIVGNKYSIEHKIFINGNWINRKIQGTFVKSDTNDSNFLIVWFNIGENLHVPTYVFDATSRYYVSVRDAKYNDYLAKIIDKKTETSVGTDVAKKPYLAGRKRKTRRSRKAKKRTMRKRGGK